MTAPTATRRGRFSAVNLRTMGLFPFPLADPSTEDPRQFKRPRYAGWQAVSTDPEEFRLAHWDEQGWNLGLYLRPSRLVVMDSDTPEAEAWAAAKLPETPWMTRTAQGRHRFYRLAEGQGTPTDNKPVPGMDRKAAGYVLAPGSWHYAAGCEYRPEGDWTLPLLELPVYSPAWFPELRKLELARRGDRIPPGNHADVVSRASHWLANVPGAVSGQGGHLQTWKAAIGLIRGFLLDEGTALYLLFNEFNPRCDPAWGLSELRHKCQQAQKAHLSNGLDGWLLNARRTA